MKNLVILAGRLPMFEGKYTPANGDKKSRMNWAMNVQLNTKNDQGYYDEALINFTAWGYYADQLQQISQLDKNDPMRKEFSSIEVTARFNAGYKDKDGNIQNNVSLDVSEFTFTKRLPQNNAGDQAFAPATPASPMGRPGVPGSPTGRPGAPAMPGVPTGASNPRF